MHPRRRHRLRPQLVQQQAADLSGHLHLPAGGEAFAHRHQPFQQAVPGVEVLLALQAPPGAACGPIRQAGQLLPRQPAGDGGVPLGQLLGGPQRPRPAEVIEYLFRRPLRHDLRPRRGATAHTSATASAPAPASYSVPLVTMYSSRASANWPARCGARAAHADRLRPRELEPGPLPAEQGEGGVGQFVGGAGPQAVAGGHADDHRPQPRRQRRVAHPVREQHLQFPLPAFCPDRRPRERAAGSGSPRWPRPPGCR